MELKWEQDQKAESMYFLHARSKEYRIVLMENKYCVFCAPIGITEFEACLFPAWDKDLDKVKENVINLLSMRKLS